MVSYVILTKNYPPQIGGIEKYAFELVKRLMSSGNTVFLLKTQSRNNFLLEKKNNMLGHFLYLISECLRLTSFFVRVLSQGLFFSYKSDIIWTMDGSIGLLGVTLGFLSRKKTRVTFHGRDVVWNFPGYQFLVKCVLSFTDEIYVVSEEIRSLLIAKCPSCSQKIILTEHRGDHLDLPYPEASSIENFLDKKNIPKNKIILFSLGRFVEKKGFHWFIEKILPFLDDRFIYVLGGFGPLKENYENIVRQKNIKNIIFLGPILDPLEKACFYLSASYFIMPNIPVKDDLEGFGLVLLEAQFYSLPIIASDTDGISSRLSSFDLILPSLEPEVWIKHMNNI